uniref:phospholipase A2 n=1 Tax=Photinus pyralis TaxID=7054 RepID=A0A1Y1L7M9_PHOPY
MAINYGKIVFIFVLCAIVVASAKNFTNFLATNVLPDGEIERRIHYRGVTAKETTVSNTSKVRLTFRQLTDGKHFIQLIYDDRDNIIDCEYLHQRDQVELFLVKFNEDLIKTTSNVTVDSLDDRRLPDDIRPWWHYSKLRDLCRKSHKAIRKSLREVRQREESSRKRSRQTRAISDYLIWPGTLWCGYDHIAPSYTNLGAMSNTDRCCRKHDHCKLNIHGFTTKYHFYNPKPFTMSHCFCDNSFRACLKMADTSDANLVGKLFFNIIQTKCFVLKPKKYCAKRSWWGKCTKTKYTKQAIIRDNLAY